MPKGVGYDDEEKKRISKAGRTAGAAGGAMGAAAGALIGRNPIAAIAGGAVGYAAGRHLGRKAAQSTAAKKLRGRQKQLNELEKQL